MKLKVLISEGEDGWLVVECPSIPGCISQGKTLEEALDNIKEAIEGCLEVMEERVTAIGGKQMMSFFPSSFTMTGLRNAKRTNRSGRNDRKRGA
jgi:predicted RNase H-like HicB family nuclease